MRNTILFVVALPAVVGGCSSAPRQPKPIYLPGTLQEVGEQFGKPHRSSNSDGAITYGYNLWGQRVIDSNGATVTAEFVEFTFDESGKVTGVLIDGKAQKRAAPKAVDDLHSRVSNGVKRGAELPVPLVALPSKTPD